jgi:hypothetical protein
VVVQRTLRRLRATEGRHVAAAIFIKILDAPLRAVLEDQDVRFGDLAQQEALALFGSKVEALGRLDLGRPFVRRLNRAEILAEAPDDRDAPAARVRAFFLHS